MVGRTRWTSYQAVGVSFLEARAVLLGTYAWTIGRADSAAPFMSESIVSSTRDPPRTWMVLNAFADTRSGLYARRIADRAYGCPRGEDFRYAFPVLRDRPLVRLPSGLLICTSCKIPVARLL